MVTHTDRRNFITGAGVAAASTAVLAVTQGLAEDNHQTGAKEAPYQAKPMPFDPKSILGISEKVPVRHYENNYVGAVKRLNAIGTQLAELDFAKAPNSVINGLKREELIASNSMILHDIYFDGLRGASKPSGALADAVGRDFGSIERRRADFAAMGTAEGGGSGWVTPIRRATSAPSTSGRPIIRRRWREVARSCCAICMNTPITWTTASPRRVTSISTWKPFIGTMPPSSTNNITEGRRGDRELTKARATSKR
jgi:hypothetical protein